MKVVALRELHRATGAVVKRLEEGGEPFVITKWGLPVAVLFPCAMDAPPQPVVSLEPPLPVPEGIDRQVFEAVDDTQQTAERIARRIGLPWQDVAVAVSRLEVWGYVRRMVMGYVLSRKGVELITWMQQSDADPDAS
ncbi:MAG: type II toxin-antitoxin system prevent-host-death family antitoxin [Actinomycetota bacterium]